MIYGPFSRSHETDIVLWDAINFPSLTLLGHNMFFIESVVAAIEVKSNYDKNMKADILQKTEDLNGIIQNYVPTYDERIFSLEARMHALENSLEFEGNLKSGKRVKSIAIIINGGENINKSFLDDIDDIFISCPNLMIFLNPGKVVVKLCEDNKHFVRIYNAKEDALLIFTQHLINIISEQVVLVEGKLFLEDYIGKIIDSIECIDVEYGCIYPDDYRKPIFSENNNKSPRG